MIRSLLALLTVLGLVLAGCAQPTPEPTEAPAEEVEATEPSAEEEEAPEEATETFKLGVMGPHSGPNARTGQEMLAGVEMAFQEADFQIGKYNIELVPIDSQSDPAKGAEAYEEAIIQKGIQAGLMNWHSSVAVACMDIAAKYKVPHFFGLGATTVVNETWHSDPDKYFYWLKGWPDPPKLSKNYVQALEYHIEQGNWEPENKTVAIWGEETDWGRSFGEGAAGQFEAAGWEVIEKEYYPLDQTEFTPLLTKWKGENPGVCIGTGSVPAMYASLIKQADEVDLGCLFVGDGLGWVGEWYDMSGESSNFVIDQIPGFVTDEAKEFASAFEEETGMQPSPSSAGLSYDYAKLFIAMAQQVYEETGELSSETIADFSRTKLQTGEWTYTDGIIMEEYAFDAESVPDPAVGQGLFTFPVLQYFDGEGKVIFPPGQAEQALAPYPAGAEGVEVTPEEAAPEEATETFKLGVMGPHSGPNARTGQEMLAGVEMAFQQADFQIGKYNIELVPIDSQSDPAKGAEAYEEAIIQKGIQAGLMNWHSSVAVACMDIAAKYKVPHFFGLGATTVVNETWHSDPDKYFYWLKGWPDPPKLSKNYVQALEYHIEQGNWEPENKTVAIWGEETDWGRSFGEGAAGQFEAAGWEVIEKEYYPLDQTEFTPLLTKWKGENPGVCIGTGSVPAMYASLIKQADEVDLGCLFVGDGLGWVGEWYDMSGESSNFVIDQIPGFVTDEAKEFASAFEEETGMQPSPSSAGLSYDYAKLFIAMAQQVYEETGELSSETIADFSRTKLQTGEWTYTDGIIMEEYAFDAESVPDPAVGQGLFTFPVLQYFDGEGKVIFPPGQAEQELVPRPAGAE